jgi:hypothetical protein
MRLKDDLFKLVKAMSKSEKRYFSLDAQKSGKKGSRYLDVFRFLSDMDEFDDERLKKKFPKNISSDKSYLYDAILRSMRDYRSTKSKAAQIKEKIQDSRYLFERGLYKQCDARLQEANDIAKELGDELMILEVARERLLTIKSNKEKNFVGYVEKVLEDKKRALFGVNQYFKYSDAYYETLVKVIKNFQSPKEEGEQIVVPDFFEEEKDIVKSPQAERRYLQSLALYAQLKGEKALVLKYFRDTVSWWHNNPSFKAEEYFRYTTDILNLVYALIKNKLFAEAEKYIEMLKQYEPKQSHEQRIWLENIYLYQLILMLNEKDYDKARNLVDEIDEGMVKYGFTNSHILGGNICVLYFLIGSYAKSREWSARIVGKPNIKLRMDIRIVIRVLNLISLYEIGDVGQLDNEINSTKRFFKKNKISTSSFEGIALTKLSRIFNTPSYEQAALKDDFKLFLEDFSKENNNNLIEALTLWLEPEKAFK